MSDQYICKPFLLKDFCRSIFRENGFSENDSKAIAEQLVTADMRGLPSHGVVRVEMYLTHAKKGAIDPRAKCEVVRETPLTAVIDAHKASGAAASEMACSMAKKKAEECGAGIVVVRNSNHHGSCGYWSMKLAGDDMLAFVSSNTPPFVAAPASKKAVIGNNPISVSVPANGRTMCFDISNGVMAFGKIHEYRRLQKPFPENAWLDENGNPTTDPFANDFLKFISLPVGMHKGFGLAVMAEAFTSVLSGGAVAAEINPPGADLDVNNPTCHCFIAFRISSFCEPEAYRNKIEELISYLHQVEVRKEGDKVFYPGEIENIAYEKSLQNGVPVPEGVRRFLCEKAEEKNIPVPADLFV